jgi:hypothetical protein
MSDDFVVEVHRTPLRVAIIPVSLNRSSLEFTYFDEVVRVFAIRALKSAVKPDD